MSKSRAATSAKAVARVSQGVLAASSALSSLAAGVVVVVRVAIRWGIVQEIGIAATLPPMPASKPDLSAFPITRKWPALHPDRLQLYSLPTPNGVKVSIALEETGLPYEVHKVSFETNDQTSPEFLSLNPNNKIPAILDPHGPGGKPLALFESGAILVYLAGKTGQLMPQDTAARYETLQWVMFQMGGIGPMFGQLGFFHKFAGKEYEDKRPRDRYVGESKRLLGVLEKHLAGRRWMMGDDYSIADIAIFPWVRNLVGFYGAGDLVEFSSFPEVNRVLDAFVARPAVQRGLNIPPR
ncbi:MAG: glutathione S-transferase protein [Ramlibacter sp.]|nr:glutathione S-transferase protein [Ramlibacter sp.]